MRKKLIAILSLAVSLACTQAAAQQYQAPEVKISQDKVRVNGKSYYAHVVTEKQTLFSISKAYDVSLQDIYDSNRNLDLENAGLKVGQVIFIPTQGTNLPPPRLFPAPLWSRSFRTRKLPMTKRIQAAPWTAGSILASTAHLPVQKEILPLKLFPV